MRCMECDRAFEGQIPALCIALRKPLFSVCPEAGWRFLGQSLAGCNALISLALAAVAAWGTAMEWRGQAGVAQPR